MIQHKHSASPYSARTFWLIIFILLALAALGLLLSLSQGKMGEPYRSIYHRVSTHLNMPSNNHADLSNIAHES